MIEKFNSLKGQIGIYTFLDFFPRFISFLTLPLFLRLILPKYWGQIALLLVVQQIYTVLIQHGVNSELLIIPSKSRSNLFYHLKRIIEMMLIAFILYIFQYFVFKYNNLEYTFNSANWMLSSAFLISLSRHIRVTLNLENKFSQFASLSIAELLFVPSFQVIFVLREIFGAGFSSTGTVSAYMIGYCIGSLLSFGFYIPFFFKNLNKEKLIKQESNRNFKIALLLQSLFIFSISFQDRFLIEYFLDSTQVAIYSSIDSIARMAKLIPQGIITFLTVNFFSKNADKNFLEKNFNNVILISSYVVILIILSKNILLDLLLPAFYSKESFLLSILAIASWFWALSNLVSIDLLDKKENKVFIYSSGLAFIVNIFLNFLFIPVYGIYGSALATIISVAILLFAKISFSVESKNYFYSLNFGKIILPIVIFIVFDLIIPQNLLILFSAVLSIIYIRKGLTVLRLLTINEK